MWEKYIPQKFYVSVLDTQFGGLDFRKSWKNSHTLLDNSGQL